MIRHLSQWEGQPSARMGQARSSVAHESGTWSRENRPGSPEDMPDTIHVFDYLTDDAARLHLLPFDSAKFVRLRRCILNVSLAISDLESQPYVSLAAFPMRFRSEFRPRNVELHREYGITFEERGYHIPDDCVARIGMHNNHPTITFLPESFAGHVDCSLAPPSREERDRLAEELERTSEWPHRLSIPMDPGDEKVILMPNGFVEARWLRDREELWVMWDEGPSNGGYSALISQVSGESPWWFPNYEGDITPRLRVSDRYVMHVRRGVGGGDAEVRFVELYSPAYDRLERGMNRLGIEVVDFADWVSSRERRNPCSSNARSRR